MLDIIYGDAEAEASRIVGHNAHWPDRSVLARDNTEEVDQRDTASHGESEADIVPVLRVSPAVTVDEETARADAVLIRARLSLDDWDRGDAERHLRENGGLESASGTDEGNAGAVEGEAGGKDGAREDFTVEVNLLGDEAERGHSDFLIEVKPAVIHSQSPPPARCKREDEPGRRWDSLDWTTRRKRNAKREVTSMDYGRRRGKQAVVAKYSGPTQRSPRFHSHR
jgi:hypothetical protein